MMKMMSSILLLLILSSCLCAATFVVNVTQSSYQAEEKQSITLEWTFTTKTQGTWKQLFIFCSLETLDTELVLYEVNEGVEIPESQDKQFSGRVQSDKDVLREGRIRLHVSRLRTEDSGRYLCDVKTEDGSNKAGCRLSEVDRFTLTSDLSALFLCPVVYKNISAVPGQKVSLPCRLPNNKPAVVVQWTRPDLEPEYVLLFRDEQLDPENQHPSFRNRVDLQDRRMEDGDVSLLLSDVKTSDTGKYECRVLQREESKKMKLIQIVYLDVAPPTENKEERKEDGSKNKHIGPMIGGLLIVALIIGLVLGFYLRKQKMNGSPDLKEEPNSVRLVDRSGPDPQPSSSEPTSSMM
ncbi:sodium channel subunit beta-4-like [Poeciliopsis prolifica]|uniref:sodium channel subunit beta-4-like n=1 Tax=Poeciliopsis prolifica TaxID=188132 RepID=UPI0024146680|nr:sodium channel subunit beta-4-like [Poeciliopsis prolifica]